MYYETISDELVRHNPASFLHKLLTQFNTFSNCCVVQRSQAVSVIEERLMLLYPRDL